MSKKGLKANVIAKKLGTTPNYVYIVRSQHKSAGKKKAVKAVFSKMQAKRIARAIKILQSL
jgi:hypothetical protein